MARDDGTSREPRRAGGHHAFRWLVPAAIVVAAVVGGWGVAAPPAPHQHLAFRVRAPLGLHPSARERSVVLPLPPCHSRLGATAGLSSSRPRQARPHLPQH